MLLVFLFITLGWNRVAGKNADEVFRQISDTVVVIHCYDKKGELKSIGSGIVLDPGTVVTNYHIIEKGEILTVTWQGREYRAKPKYTDRFRDVCSLEVPVLHATPVIPGNTSDLKIGDKVYAAGSPYGMGLTFSDGIISGLRAVDKGYYIQTTAPISSGSSGGGLFDEQAKLIGLPTYFFKQGQQLNFALPVEWVMDLRNRHFLYEKTISEESELTFNVLSLEEKQDWGGVITLCQNWIKKFPGSYEAWGHLGFASLQKGYLVQAIDAYQRAIQINPDYAHYWAELASAYSRTGQSTKQIEAYRQAVRINNNFAPGWINLGIACYQNGQFDNAIIAFEEAVRINTNDASSWAFLGQVCRDYGLFTKAVAAYEEAVRLSPKNAQYRLHLGDVYGLADQKKKQQDSYNLLLQINPDYPDAWVSLGVSYGLAGLEAQERAAYMKALSINPEHNLALYNLALDYLEHKERENAMGIYLRLRQLNPELAQILFRNFDSHLLLK